MGKNAYTSFAVADIPVEEWALPMEDHLAQPWDCESRDHSVVVMDRVSSSPWISKINNEFYQSKYLFTVDYTDHPIADDLHNINNLMLCTSQKIVSGKETL